MNINRESDLQKSRKRNSAKISDLEEAIPFTEMFKPRVKHSDFEKEDKPTPKCSKNLLCYFCDFCDNTSIHGFKFLGERQRYIVEKIWWFIVVSFAITGSTLLIYNTYMKWVKAPVIVTFSTTETPIWKIPFPAVTICPELKINKQAFNYSDVLSRIIFDQNITDEEREYFSFFHMVCDDIGVDVIDDYNFNATTDAVNIIDLYLTYYDVFANTEFDSCKWMGSKRECNDLLTSTFTDQGRCYTFNKLSEEDTLTNPNEHSKENSTGIRIKQWSLEEGYPPNANLDTYPLRTILAGSKAGLHIDMTVEEEEMDYACGELQGFKVTLHHPAEAPNMDKHFRVPLDEAVFVSVKPRMMTSASEISGYKPHERHCYLPGEKQLATYKIYTQQNCMSECLTNFTKEICGCVAYHMADFELHDICTLRSKSCLEKARVSFLQKDLDFELKTNDTDEDILEQCNCLPSCTSIDFEAETSQTKYDWHKTFEALIKTEEDKPLLKGFHLSKLIVYYKDMQFMTSERHELYGTIDFLANCGGLLGLFCGFSFTSSMEILYYLTLRIVCNLRKFGRRVWSGAPELM